MDTPSTVFGKFIFSKFSEAGIDLTSKDAAKLGEKAFGTLARKQTSAEVLEEAAHIVVVKFLTGAMTLRKGSTFSQAEQFVLASFFHAVVDTHRHLDATRDRFLTDEEPVETDDEGAEAEAIESALLVHELRARLHELNPRALDWADIVLEDAQKVDLADTWGVSPAAVTRFEKSYLGGIGQLVKKHFEA